MILVLAFAGRIKMNPDGTVGNSAGNLNNGGLFCEYDGTVYFSNKTDGGSLYAMDVDESNVRKLNTMKVGNILAGGKYLYYFQTGSADSANSGFGQIQGMKSFDRCDLKGKNTTALSKDVVVKGQLVNNYLYLLTTSNTSISFYKVKIDNTDKTELADYEINPACAQDGVIYYTNTQENHNLYTLNTSNDVANEVLEGNIWYPMLVGNYIYYMDASTDYSLCRFSLNSYTTEVLTEDRVDCFNVGDGYIYYQKNADSPQLICMSIDGSFAQVVAEGTFTNINMTSRYVYFQEFGDETTMYHAPIGSSSYSTFTP
jgi:hypothetical protein